MGGNRRDISETPLLPCSTDHQGKAHEISRLHSYKDDHILSMHKITYRDHRRHPTRSPREMIAFSRVTHIDQIRNFPRPSQPLFAIPPALQRSQRSLAFPGSEIDRCHLAKSLPLTTHSCPFFLSSSPPPILPVCRTNRFYRPRPLSLAIV